MAIAMGGRTRIACNPAGRKCARSYAGTERVPGSMESAVDRIEPQAWSSNRRRASDFDDRRWCDELT
jgi:hypothetical protein